MTEALQLVAAVLCSAARHRYLLVARKGSGQQKSGDSGKAGYETPKHAHYIRKLWGK